MKILCETTCFCEGKYYKAGYTYETDMKGWSKMRQKGIGRYFRKIDPEPPKTRKK